MGGQHFRIKGGGRKIFWNNGVGEGFAHYEILMRGRLFIMKMYPCGHQKYLFLHKNQLKSPFRLINLGLKLIKVKKEGLFGG